MVCLGLLFDEAMTLDFILDPVTRQNDKVKLANVPFDAMNAFIQLVYKGSASLRPTPCPMVPLVNAPFFIVEGFLRISCSHDFLLM